MPRTLNKPKYGTPRYGTTDARQAEALRQLELEIPLGHGRSAIPDDERLLRLMQRLEEFNRPANLFQGSLTAFCKYLVWTVDEAAAGVVARMPSWRYLAEMDDAVLTCPLLLIEKSRRVLASWRMCAIDVWLAAGGSDPRWPALMQSTENRRILLAARKLEDVGGSAWFLETRVKRILDEFEARDLRRFWPTFPTWKYRFTQIAFSNGSTIDCVPEGPDQMRGAGATLIHAEELAFWNRAQPSIAAALPTLRGGGHLVAVSTPQANTYAHSIVRGTLTRRGYR